MLVPFGLCLLSYIIEFTLAALLLQICHFTTRLSYVKFFLGNKGLSWDNSILIDERKTMNSSILVIHVNLRDRVNSDSGIMKMARYAETSTQSRSLSC